ncbi:hypothetical protein ACCT14_16095 [Rhizobium brockwellii]|jgi:hypothetical protein|uniref:Uncharacterized protein n=1 Tax=Rhizobium leguminosarum TaxID=384 RepID=A0A4Q8XWF2_RHILE|nr:MULTISPECIES: hypothetical protein [Rhizobium]KPN28424.1 hypothetical protein KS05_09010 [Rhizobium brockwellii]MDV4154238.1 hypothetical protein [Rhizobium brockwellii]NZD48575.1 hypothetical protein [Rhizobium leguminosarum]QIO52699.1 hypothetical protein HA461_16570 [Rhizobium leguminosarum bv. trifolii]QJX04330.1 hypothetical protein RLCC275e_04985 [Rhizobium brockwellii]
MEISSNIRNYYGVGGLFDQSAKSKNQQTTDFDSTARNTAPGLEPSSTPPSIANTIWALQSSEGPYINPPSDEEVAASAAHDSLVDEFSKWGNMTPAEYIRARYLEQHDLTEDDLAAMPAEQRAAIEKEIADQIKREMAGIEDDGTKTTDDITAA